VDRLRDVLQRADAVGVEREIPGRRDVDDRHLAGLLPDQAAQGDAVRLRHHDVEQVEVVQVPLRDPALQLVSAQERVDVRVDVGMSLEVFLQAAFQFPEIRRIVVARRYFVQGAALFLPIF